MASRGRLAAAGLAYQTHGSTRLRLKVTPSTAFTWPTVLLIIPPLMGKYLLQVLDLQNVLGIIPPAFQRFLLVCHGYSPTFPSK